MACIRLFVLGLVLVGLFAFGVVQAQGQDLDFIILPGTAVNQGSLPNTVNGDRGIEWDGTQFVAIENHSNAMWTLASAASPADATVAVPDLATGLTSPDGITWDGSQYVITDQGGDEIWTRSGLSATPVAVNQGSLPGGLSSPMGIAWDGNQYVILNSSGEEVWTLADATQPGTAVNQGSLPSEFGNANGGIDWDGNQYVIIDTGNNTLWTLADATQPGNAVNQGSLPGGLSSPTGITWDGSQYVILNHISGADQVWTLSRHLLSKGVASDLPPGALEIFGIVDNTLLVLDGTTGTALKTVGTDGTPVGDSVITMTWHDGTIYAAISVEGAGFDRLITVNPITGQQTDIGRIDLDNESFFVTGLASENDVLYGIGGKSVDDTMIVTFNTATGGTTTWDANLDYINDWPYGLVTGRENDGLLYYAYLTSHNDFTYFSIIKHRISTKTETVVDTSGGQPRHTTGATGFEQAGGIWYFWQRGQSDVGMQKVEVNPLNPDSVTTVNMVRAHGNLEGVASFPPLEAGTIILASRNEADISETASSSRSLWVTTGQLPGWLFANGEPGELASPIAVTYPSGSTNNIEFTLKDASGRQMRNPRDSAWLTNRSIELRMSLRDRADSPARFLQTYNSSPQRFSLTSDGGWKISVPNTSAWTSFFDVDTRGDFRGTILFHLVEACGVPARHYEVDTLIQQWDLVGAYQCGNRAVSFTSAAHAGLSFDSYLAAGFDVLIDYANTYVLQVADQTEAVVIANQPVGAEVAGVYLHASPSKQESVMFLPQGDYLLILKGDADGEYNASLRFAGPAGENLFGSPPENFLAQTDRSTEDKAVLAQWDAVEGAESYFLRVDIAGLSYLIDTGGATAARVPVDPSSQQALVSVFGWKMVIGGVAFTLDSAVRLVVWEPTVPTFSAEIPTPASNPGSGLVSAFATSVLTSIGMESYGIEDDAGDTVIVDPATEKASMVAVALCGFAAMVVFAIFFTVSKGNIMIATSGAVLVWSGIGPIFFELQPAVTYGPIVLILFLGLLAVIKKYN